jgi:acylphosphatase
LKYEIFGKVQGVFFRKRTKKKAEELGIRGWVQNTTQNTVIGEIEGKSKEVERMKNWLTKEGSPKSRIEKAVFEDEQTIKEYTFFGFTIMK